MGLCVSWGHVINGGMIDIQKWGHVYVSYMEVCLIYRNGAMCQLQKLGYVAVI